MEKMLLERIKETDLNDFLELLKLSRKVAKEETLGGFLQNALKVAVLGTCDVQYVCAVLKVLFLKNDMTVSLFQGEYNSIQTNVFDQNSQFYSFCPDIAVLLPDYRDIEKYFPNLLDKQEEVEKKVSDALCFFETLFSKIHATLPSCQILCSNIASPPFDVLGNFAGNCLFSQESVFKLVNLALIKQKPQYVTLLDTEGVSCFFGKNNWFDPQAFFLHKSAFCLDYVGVFCNAIVKQILCLQGKIKKCLVLDLDGTLWGGVVADEGAKGINLDPNDAIGEAYRAFQEYLKKLKQRGVILSVCSKNDEEIAKEPFLKNEYMVLKEDDISCFVANWNDKATNIRQIAKELNVSLDSLVFFDDNPTERQIIKMQVPEVTVIDVPDDPAFFIEAVAKDFPFEWTQITKEDISRTHSYQVNQEQDLLQKNCASYADFLVSLEMKGSFEKVKEETILRFTQLTNKSNQFNLRTQRYTGAQVRQMAQGSDFELFCVSLKDKFCDYGIICCLVLHYKEEEKGIVCEIENWVISCRVLKKTVENFAFFHIQEVAKEHGCVAIKGEYIPTAKNKMVAHLYECLGFEETENDKVAGTKKYVFDLKKKQDKKQEYYIKETQYE